MTRPANVHASAVAFGPMRGVLILGPSGAGKSRLALALIDRGAQLVADDQVMLAVDQGALFARPPAATAGLIEARGLGILRLAHRRLARIVLAVDLASKPARLPEPVTVSLGGVTIPCLSGGPDGPAASALAHYIMGLGLAVPRGAV